MRRSEARWTQACQIAREGRDFDAAATRRCSCFKNEAVCGRDQESGGSNGEGQINELVCERYTIDLDYQSEAALKSNMSMSTYMP